MARPTRTSRPASMVTVRSNIRSMPESNSNGHLEDHDRGRGTRAQKAPHLVGHARMDEGFEPTTGVLVGKHDLGQSRAIDGSILGDHRRAEPLPQATHTTSGRE